MAESCALGGVEVRPLRLRIQLIERTEENGGKVREKAMTVAWLDSGNDRTYIAASGPDGEVSKYNKGNPMWSQGSQVWFKFIHKRAS